jgi:hypothetical protein
VNIPRTVLADLKGVARLLVQRRTAASFAGSSSSSQHTEAFESAARFARLGFLSTVAYVALFLSMRGAIGNYPANAISLVACTFANLAAHRRLALRDIPLKRGALFVAGAATLVMSLVLTSVALIISGSFAGDGWLASLIALFTATIACSFVKFAVMRTLVFRASCRQSHADQTNPPS